MFTFPESFLVNAADHGNSCRKLNVLAKGIIKMLLLVAIIVSVKLTK